MGGRCKVRNWDMGSSQESALFQIWHLFQMVPRVEMGQVRN